MNCRPIVATFSLLATIATTIAQPSAETLVAAPAELIGPTTATMPQPATRQASELVVIQPGDWPIILSAPHGGRLSIPGATTRTGANVLARRGSAKTNFTNAFDRGVDAVAFRLADVIEARTGRRPYVVIAGFSRTNVDANRAPEEAYESEAGRAQYERYHDAIRAFRTEIIGRWRRGLLIDIHGHGVDADSIIRGTADWTSVRHLVEEFGKEPITRDLLGPLGAAGNPFVPPLADLDAAEYAALNGGFITRAYGSYAGGNFDAIQLELAATYRRPENITRFCEQLADGLVPFTERYLLIGTGTTTGPTDSPPTAPATRATHVNRAWARAEAYLDAAKAGRVDEASRMAVPGSAAGSVAQLGEFGEVRDARIRPARVHADDTVAIAVTAPLTFDGVPPHALVLELTANGQGEWLIADIDLETPDGAAERVRVFRATRANAIERSMPTTVTTPTTLEATR